MTQQFRELFEKSLLLLNIVFEPVRLSRGQEEGDRARLHSTGR